MAPVYPNLAAHIARRGVKKSVIAQALNITNRAFYNKLHGISEFTWREVCLIQQRFFPDVQLEILFSMADDESV